MVCSIIAHADKLRRSWERSTSAGAELGMVTSRAVNGTLRNFTVPNECPSVNKEPYPVELETEVHMKVCNH